MSETEVPTGPERAHQLPVVSGPPVEIARGVFVIPDGGIDLVPNVGVIVGDRAALVVDAGLGGRSGSVARSIAEELAGGRPLFLTLTHFHPEHGFGAQAFADATIVYNRPQHEELRQKGPNYLAMFNGLGDAVIRELADFEFVDPHVVYDGAVDLDLGGTMVQLRTWGPAHTRGDQGIYVPDEKILFVGDLVEGRSFPVLPFFPPEETEVDAREWMVVLEHLQAIEAETVVPGHGELGDRGLLATAQEYLAFLEAETNRLADAGENPDEIPEIVVPNLIARYPQWSGEPALLAAGVQSILFHRG